jgi:hypothetical protein
LVLGLWPDSPFGTVQDAMVERADGQRILIAPRADVAQYIAGTYRFDDVRIEPTALRIDGARWTFASSSLRVTVEVGRRTAIGVLLSLVPRAVARTRWWCALLDPVARRLRPGVRTRGSAGGGRREWYCGLDERRLRSAQASWDGADLGAIRPVDPPVRFGFGSTPRTPAWVRVTTLIDDAAEFLPC